MAPVEETHEFRNTTTGFVGAIKIDRRGDKEAVAVPPGESVELNEEEQQATARAHKNPADNPFLDQDYEVRDPQTGEVLESGRRPPLELVTEERPIGSQAQQAGAPSAPSGPPPEGQYQDGEEVAEPLRGAESIAVRTESG